MMTKMYEGVTLDNGLIVKNGVIQNVPQFDHDAVKARIREINSAPLPQTIAKRKAREAARGKRR